MRRRVLALMLLTCAAGPAFGAEVFVPYRETREDGAYIDWLDGHAGSAGRTRSYRDLRVQMFYRMAKQVAAESARTRLSSFLRGISIDGTRRLGDDPALFDKVKKLIADLEPVRVEKLEPSTVRAIIEVPWQGDTGLLGLVLPEAGRVARAGRDAVAGGPPAPAGAVTGLVLDATRIEGAAPSLLPRIVDDRGRAVFGADRVDVAAARARGLAAFASRVELKQPPATLRPREGSRPMRITAVRAEGPARTWFVVAAADADRILKEDASAGFLRECRVLIVLPPPGGPAPRPGASPRKPQQLPPPTRPRELEKAPRWD